MEEDGATESEDESNSVVPKCTSPHDGRLLSEEVFPIHIDQLFTMLFTNSQFAMTLQQTRKASNCTEIPWRDIENNAKERILTMTMPLNQTIGPKSSNVTETQITLPCSVPGQLYSIDVVIENKGIPYADRFYLPVHYCMVKCSDRETSLSIYGNVKFKKSVLGLVKSIIEKNTWPGLQDTYDHLCRELWIAIENGSGIKHKKKDKRRKSTHGRNTEEIGRSSQAMSPAEHIRAFQIDITTLYISLFLILLIIINIYLYFKLWTLEVMFPPQVVNPSEISRKMQEAHESFVSRLRESEVMPNMELEKWNEIVTKVVMFLKNAEESLIKVVPSKLDEGNSS